MSMDARSAARPARTAATAGRARLRRGSLAVLVLVVVEYGIGMHVNVYAGCCSGWGRWACCCKPSWLATGVSPPHQH